ncbi:glycoside hydrolase family 88 protein [Aegicerativicinus sediminis]|uniref:glycoside hydrolase family 88 protein n=1 Tax=Aegicerativicinus sediminis TaxID=2893202 RepID=UPI001E51A27F|nr:glycoside hydrolase family 88 protein [Aegicerativicinus sediminis]
MKNLPSRLSLLGIILFYSFTAHSQKLSIDQIDTILDNAVKSYQFIGKDLPEDRFPTTYYEKGDILATSGSGWWCSGFYPGSLLYLYKFSRNDDLLNTAKTKMTHLEKEQFNTSTHDLGFMMFCSFGQLMEIEPSEKWESILMNSAKSLATRFNPQIGCIKSWDSNIDTDFKVIIDNMMNLELLYWASEFSGDPSFKNIADTHAETTIKNHFREDNSSFHLVNYNSETGEIKEKKTVQGAFDESAWSRGQAWGLYGFTRSYQKTGNKKYLNQAKKIANFLLNHSNFPTDGIPYWDFNAPNIPDAYRDSSAAAIMASSLLDLSSVVDGADAVNYKNVAIKILTSLSSPEYLAKPIENGGFLLKHAVGNLPSESEVNVPLSYADYYFLEALMKYRSLLEK